MYVCMYVCLRARKNIGNPSKNYQKQQNKTYWFVNICFCVSLSLFLCLTFSQSLIVSCFCSLFIGVFVVLLSFLVFFLIVSCYFCCFYCVFIVLYCCFIVCMSFVCCSLTIFKSITAHSKSVDF